MPNPYVNKVVQSNGTTLIDISDTTATPEDVAEGKVFYLADGTRAVGTASSGSTYETIIPLQTINCSIGLSTGAYGGYITNYTEYIADGQKYRVIFDGTEYASLTARYYGSGTTYLYLGDISIEGDGSTVYPFEIMLYNGTIFYLAVRGSGSHTLQVDKIIEQTA